jgi:hypothetical protein
MRRRTASVIAILGFWLVTAPLASAQTPGLHVDPSSPGGKEYAIPLDQARGDAAGGPAGTAKPPDSGSGSTEGPLFGVGVGSSDGDAGAGKKPRDQQTPRRSAPSSSPKSTALDLASVANTPSGDPELLWILGPALGLILVGALFGMVLRRRNVTNGPLTGSGS